MCKKLIYLVFAFLVVGLIGPVAAQQVDMEIGFATQPPVIDGEVDEIWADASTQYFVPLDDPANASGSWMALYDSENLYVIVDMTDDNLQNDSDGSWQDDSVEVYFDGGNTKVNTPLSGDDHQYTFAWTTDEIQGTNIDGATEGIEHAQVDTDTGWRIEIKLPWLSLQGAAPQAGDLIGIDCYYNDDDGGGDSCEGKMLTFSTEEFWNDASGWGTAMLTAIPEPEPANPVHSYTFEDGTANDSVGSAHGTLVGDAAVVGGALVTYDQDNWMEMPGDVIAMNTFDEVTIEAWYTPTAGANTGWSMLAYFGDSVDGLGSNGFFITSARADDKSRAAISIGDIATPWASETGADGPEYDDGLLHHMVSTINATDITLYIDGMLIASTPLDPHNSISGISQNFAYLAKGGYGGDPEWIGSINEFNIYDRAISLAQVEANYAAGPAKPVPVHRYTFEDGTANDNVGSAHGTLIGDAAVVDGALVLDGDGDWMEMPGEVIAMNTYSEVTIEAWFTSVAGGNAGFHMLAAFGEEGTGAADWAGYKYLFISPARGDDVSRAAIQTSSMDDSPWDDETGVSATVEHDDGLEHHFVTTVNATDITFYIDGELIGSAALDPNNSISGISQAVAFLGKGVYPADPLWTGSVNEFNIYNRTISLAEVKANYAAGPVKPLVHQYTFEDGTANDSVGSAHGTLVGDAAVVDGALVLDGDGDWMDMPGDVIAMNTYSEVTIETWFTSVAGGNTGFHMVTAFGEEGTGDNPGYGYKYICITPARGDDVSRAMIQTVSMDNDPWSEETGVSDVIEHDDGLPHHMVCTVDNTELAFYVDGVLIGTAALDPPGNSIAGIGTDAAHIGKGVYGVDPLWAGSVEELSIYNRALSLAQVEANYAAGPQKAGPAPVDPGTEGLMLHLPLDTASRGVTLDSSGNNLDGTLFGDPTFVEGVVVMAMDFDGDGDYVDCGGNAEFSLTDAMTVSTWVSIRSVTTAWMAMVAKGESAWRLGVNNETTGIHYAFTGSARDYQAANSVIELPFDEWHHVAATYSTDVGAIVYIDGVADAENTDTGGIVTNDMPLLLGDNPESTGRFFDGLLDEVRIYNRALSAEEVLFLAGM